MENPIEGLMKTTMESIKQMIDVNTVVGEAVETKEGSTIIPITRVSIGFASGGSEFCKDSKAAENKADFPFGGGSGAGMSVQPVAFLVVKNEQIKLIPVKQTTNSLERIVDGLPEIIDDFMGLFKRDKEANLNMNIDVKDDGHMSDELNQSGHTIS